MAQMSSDKITNEIKQQSEAAIDTVSKVVESLSSELEGIPKLIKKYPVQSVLIGFGAGVAAALLLKKLSK